MCDWASVSTRSWSVSYYEDVFFVFRHTYPALRPKASLTRTSVGTFLEVALAYRFPVGLLQYTYGPALQLNSLDRLLLV